MNENDADPVGDGMKRILVVGLFCLGLAAAAGAAQEPLYVGIIEQSPSHYDNEAGSTPFMVRAAFFKQDSAWQAFPSMKASLQSVNNDISAFPAHVNWTVAFHGKNRGQFQTTRPAKWESHMDVGLLQPDPSEKVDLIPNEPDGFRYWKPMDYRPLVVVSEPHVADPDDWQAAHPPADIVRKLIPFFRKEVRLAPLSCGRPASRYTDALIRGRMSYMSKAGAWLVQLSLDDSAVQSCAGSPDPAYDSRWFYVQGDDVRFLGQSLERIDAGDYDDQGNSEVIFHKAGSNSDGYVLFYDHFTKKAEFGWIY